MRSNRREIEKRLDELRTLRNNADVSTEYCVEIKTLLDEYTASTGRKYHFPSIRSEIARQAIETYKDAFVPKSDQSPLGTVPSKFLVPISGTKKTSVKRAKRNTTS
jgi:hypothetical protein